MTALGNVGSHHLERPLVRTTRCASQTAATPIQYEVVHWIRGRIRLRIPRLAHDARFARRLSDALMLLPELKEARISTHSASLVVTYRLETIGIDQRSCNTADHAILPLLLDALRAAGNTDVAQLATQVQVSAVEHHRSELPGDAPINYFDRLVLPVLGIVLSAGALAGLAIPGALVGGVILAAALPIFKRTLQGIRDEKRLTVDFLDATAIVLLTAQTSFLAPAIVVSIIEVSEIARDWTARRSRRATLDLILAQDRQMLVERAGQQALLRLDEVKAGDILLLYPGERIPVDGFILEGSALVAEHQLHGDMTSAPRSPGDAVHATTLLIEGRLRVVATRTGHDTLAAAVMGLLDTAPRTDTRVSNYARKVGNGAVVPTLAIAAALWGTTGSAVRAAGIVSLDLGTGMRVSAPIAILNAQAAAARQGILIRSGRALEMLAAVDVVVFDKTATLTQGNPRVIEVIAVNADVETAMILQLAASAEQELAHPIASAITGHAESLGILPRVCTTWHYVAGQGVVATIDNEIVHVGNRALLAQAGVNLALATADACMTATQVYVARAGELIGVIRCDDVLRSESAGVLASLRTMQKRAMIATGDSSVVAHAAALALAVAPDHVHAEMLPQQKVALVQALQARGHKVAVVGDGINDAAAMAHADVAIALGSATDLAQESADVVLTNNDLSDLVTAMEIAQHTLGVIEQNKWIVVAPNVAAIVYSVVNVLNPIAGVVINNGTAVVAALNSLRPIRRRGVTPRRHRERIESL